MEQMKLRKPANTWQDNRTDDMRSFYEQFRTMPKEEQMYIKGRMDSYNDRRQLAAVQSCESVEAS